MSEVLDHARRNEEFVPPPPMEITQQRGPTLFFVGPDGSALTESCNSRLHVVKQSVRPASRHCLQSLPPFLWSQRMVRIRCCRSRPHPLGEELLPNAQGKFEFPAGNTGPFVVLPEEALQQLPSDDEESSDSHGHSHGHGHSHAQPDATKQAVLQERRRRMEDSRKNLIKELYIPRHPHLFTLTPEVRGAMKSITDSHSACFCPRLSRLLK